MRVLRQNRKEGRKRRRKTVAAAICLVVMAGAATVGAAAWFSGTQETALARDTNAVTGVMPGVDREQRKKELQKVLDESMIAFSVNTNPVFSDGKAEGNLLLENPEQNAKLLVAEIVLDDTGESVYQSKAISPGSYISEAKLKRELQKGDYPATVYFSGYTEDTQKYIGKTGAKIEIHVEN